MVSIQNRKMGGRVEEAVSYTVLWHVVVSATSERKAMKLLARVEDVLRLGSVTSPPECDSRYPGLYAFHFGTLWEVQSQDSRVAIAEILPIAGRLGSPLTVAVPRVWDDGSLLFTGSLLENARFHIAGLRQVHFELAFPTPEQVPDSTGGTSVSSMTQESSEEQ